MKKKSMTGMNDELRPEYDLRKLLKRGVRGKYSERYRAGTNLVLLEPDVAKVFPSAKTVNESLRLVIQLTKILDGKKPSSVKSLREICDLKLGCILAAG